MKVDVEEWQTAEASELSATLSRWVDEIAIKGLVRPEHSVRQELDDCARYIWKPLARFCNKGVQHTTALRTRYWGVPQHSTQRGNNRQACFFDNED